MIKIPDSFCNLLIKAFGLNNYKQQRLLSYIIHNDAERHEKREHD